MSNKKSEADKYYELGRLECGKLIEKSGAIEQLKKIFKQRKDRQCQLNQEEDVEGQSI
jgi:hypothetical protein